MIYRVRQRLADKRGASRTITILLILIGIMAAIIAAPFVLQYLHESSQFACQTALDSARRQMAADYMLTNGIPTVKDAQGHTTYALSGWDDLCPSGGTVYVREVDNASDSEMPYELICGLHNPDTKLCTRLNANYVLAQIQGAVEKSRLGGVPYPETVTVKLHGKEISAQLVDSYTGLRRGTADTKGYDGTVIYYSIVGHSDFGSDSNMEQGQVWYFCYADENHCATWSSRKSWTGDSYE